MYYRVTYKKDDTNSPPLTMDVEAGVPVEAIVKCTSAEKCDIKILDVRPIENSCQRGVEQKETSNTFADAVRGVFWNVEATDAAKYAGDKAHDLEVLKKVESFLKNSN